MAGSVWRIALLTSFVTSVGLAFGFYTYLNNLGVFDLSKESLSLILNHKDPDNSLVFDRNGEKIGEFFDSYHVFLPYEKIPPSLVQAIIAIEDRSFWTHKGFDPKGILRAALVHLRGGASKQGASTLTQQIVRNFLLSRERTAERKIQEIALAIQLERRIDKKKIVEIYANSLFLGNGAYGVGAAAFRYFGKPVDQLTVPEAALIAGLFQSPSRYNPSRYPQRAKARQEQVLKAMYRAKMLTLADTKSYLKQPLVYKEYKPLNTQVAPYFVDFVRDQAMKLLSTQASTLDNRGLRIFTTLDRELQKMAEVSLDESKDLLDAAQKKAGHLHRFRSVRGAGAAGDQASVEAAILSIDPKNGEILTMVGGRDYEKSKFNRPVQALRSPGSAFKPIIFSLALAKKWKWSDVIFVSPVTVDNYRPHTPDGDMLTETTLLRAFYRSMNTPTIELGQKLGLVPVLQQAQLLGIKSPLKPEFGTMLGSSEVTMLDMARVYSTFANAGKKVEPIAITRIEDAAGQIIYKADSVDDRTETVLTPQISFLMTQGMRDVLAMGTGFESSRLASVAAGKTGTSNDSTDNWFCGYSPNLTTIVWVGTDEHKQIFGNFTGGKLALPIWDHFMSKAFTVRRPEPFRPPPGIVQAMVHPKYGHRSPTGVKMYFLRGEEPPGEPSALEALSNEGNAGYRDVFGN